MSAHRTIGALLLMAIVITGSIAPSPAEAASHAHPRPALASLAPELVVAGTPAQEVEVMRIASVFTDLEMALPDLVVRFWDDEEPCDDGMGMFRPRATGWVIDICSDLRFVVPHEMGHAWELANLDDDARTAHMAARGLDSWRHAERAKAGIEDVALVIQLVILGGGESGRPAIDETFARLLELAGQSSHRS